MGGNPPPPNPEPLCKSCPACCPCTGTAVGLCCCNCCHRAEKGAGLSADETDHGIHRSDGGLDRRRLGDHGRRRNLEDPKALVLQKADLPAAAVKGPPRGRPELVRRPRIHRLLQLPRRRARRGADERGRRLASDREGEGRLQAHAGGVHDLSGMSPLTLSSYGSEQQAEFGSRRTSRARRPQERPRVALEIESCSARSPAGVPRRATPPKLTKAQALSELRKYARKQQARIGNG